MKGKVIIYRLITGCSIALSLVLFSLALTAQAATISQVASQNLRCPVGLFNSCHTAARNAEQSGSCKAPCSTTSPCPRGYTCFVADNASPCPRGYTCFVADNASPCPRGYTCFITGIDPWQTVSARG